MRFDDDKYIQDVINYNKYPKIHDDIFYLSKYVDAENVLDLGCCTGLLSHRLSSVYKNVVGVEANNRFIQKTIKKDNIKYINLKICKDNLCNFENILTENNIEAVYARRVIPELHETGGIELVNNICDIFYKHKVKYIILEGRKPTKNAKNPLNILDKELQCFSKYYTEDNRYKNCCILKLK